MKTNIHQNGQGLRFHPVQENQCIWMRNGTVGFRICNNAFDCTSCDFDKEMSKQLAQKSTSWGDVMRQPHLHKNCRHMLTGRVLFNLCSHNFICKDCAYDQQLYEYELLLLREDDAAHANAQLKQVVNA